MGKIERNIGLFARSSGHAKPQLDSSYKHVLLVCHGDNGVDRCQRMPYSSPAARPAAMDTYVGRSCRRDRKRT